MLVIRGAAGYFGSQPVRYTSGICESDDIKRPGGTNKLTVSFAFRPDTLQVWTE